MAILENETRNYFRVNLERSFIQNGMAFALIVVYGSEADRDLEKSRANVFQIFDVNCEKMLQQLSVSEQNAELYGNFAKAVKDINARRYINCNAILPEMTFPDEVLRSLLQCGYQSNWISRPICIVSTKLVNCGMHRGENFTSEYIYGVLKKKMATNISDI